MRKYFFALLILFFFYLVMYPAQAAASARDGLILWYHSIVPVLFPFMFICRFMIQSDFIHNIPFCITKPLRILLRCSHEGALSILAGFLCGFPMGARFAFDLYQTNKISKTELNYLLSFVNNLSPGFLISYLAVSQLKHPELKLAVLLIILGASLLYGFILSRRLTVHVPVSDHKLIASENHHIFSLLDDSIYISIMNTLRLGGYIIFFSIVSDSFALLPISHPLLTGIAASVEVTKGIEQICRSDHSFLLRMFLSVSLSAFGGWSAAFQTAGVCMFSSRQFIKYIKSRMIITLLSIVLFILWYYFRFILLKNPLPE